MGLFKINTVSSVYMRITTFPNFFTRGCWSHQMLLIQLVYITFQIFDRNHIPSCTSAGSVLQLCKVSFKSNEPLCLQAHLSIQNVFQSISLIISPSKFWTATIFLHAHLQVMHYNCVKFHKNPISCLGQVALTR